MSLDCILKLVISRIEEKISHVAVGIFLLYLRFPLLLSQFQPIFVSSVAISSGLMLLFQGHVAYQNFTLTGPHLPNLLIKSHYITCVHPKHVQYAVSY